MTTTTTDRQIIANRQNALKSSGPQTPEGKAVAKRNALRHGILAKEVVIRGENVKENPREFRSILARFWQDLAPVWAVEEMLVERIVTCYWRLRRVLIAEVGAIKLGTDTGSWERLMARCDEVKRMKDLKLVYKESDFKKSSFGVQYLLDTLREVQDYIEETGELDDLILKRVAEVFGNEDEGIFQAMAIFRRMLIDNPEGLEPDALKEKHTRVVLDCIDTQQKRLKGLASILAENEANEESAKTALSQPPLQGGCG